jgi:cupin 2 domain-containing protein
MSKEPRRRIPTSVSFGNLLAMIPKKLKEEQFTELLNSHAVRIERIVSRGQACGPDDWYDEQEAEWVVLLAGSARLVFEDEAEPRALSPGDYLYIPPRKRHRVDRTDPDEATVWLAVHFAI